MPKLLVVDDEPEIRGLYGRVLELDGHDVLLASTVQEAIEIVASDHPDVIVSDINMPGPNGLELLRRIRAISPMIKMIMVTGMPTVEHAAQAVRDQAFDFVSKPVNPSVLIGRVNAALHLKSLEEENRRYAESLERLVGERTSELEFSRLEVIWRLAHTAELRDDNTGEHILRVGHYCRILGERLGLASETLPLLFGGSLLHDVGKIGIPDSILLKPGKLTSEERSIMESHCKIGHDLLREPISASSAMLFWQSTRELPAEKDISNPLLEIAARISLSHHEKWDGGGYPLKLSGSDIPIEGRITAVADVFDALCHQRPYKPAIEVEEVLVYIREQAGRHFDPEIVEAMFDSLEEIEVIHNGSDGQAGTMNAISPNLSAIRRGVLTCSNR